MNAAEWRRNRGGCMICPHCRIGSLCRGFCTADWYCSIRFAAPSATLCCAHIPLAGHQLSPAVRLSFRRRCGP